MFLHLIWNIFYLFYSLSVSSLWTFRCFCTLPLVGYLLSSADDLFMLSLLFSRSAFDFHGTRYLSLDLVGMHFATTSIWVITKFSYSSFWTCLLDVYWRLQTLFLVVTVSNTPVDMRGSLVLWRFNYVFLFSAWFHMNLYRDTFIIRRLSFKIGTSITFHCPNLSIPSSWIYFLTVVFFR